MSTFDKAFVIVVGEEGAFGNDPNDAGNWTGGQCGHGKRLGTKYGISAASYPTTDIVNLTLDQAKAIYLRDFWTLAGCPSLPPGLALLVFDAAVNNGVSRAATWLQNVAGTRQDGNVGPVTLAALAAVLALSGRDIVCGRYLALRLGFMSTIAGWRLYGAEPITGRPLGWAERLCSLPYLAMQLETAQ